MLRLYDDYSREEVQKIFDAERKFIPQAGTWGLHGIVPLSNRPGDFVFFVTLGKQQGEYIFDESVTSDGVLSWQSQPRQKFSDKQIHQFIHHDELSNSIYLFLRTGRGNKYTYFGKLKYLTHDFQEREEPVHFQWQLISGVPSVSVCVRIALTFAPSQIEAIENLSVLSNASGLNETSPPKKLPNISSVGVSTVSFKKNKSPNYAEIDARNRVLGLQGEILVLKHEKKALSDGGRDDLARLVRHISVEDGDGEGFDILSFDVTGKEKFIEVKTTIGGINTDFFLTSHELAFAFKQPENYFMYRVYNFDAHAQYGDFYCMQGNPLLTWDLTPLLYRAKIKRIS